MTAANKEAVLRQAYTDLAKAERSGDFEKALKTCNRILKTYQNETTAVRCKLVCLIQLERFEDVLTFMKKTAPKLLGSVTFEKAYAEYRLQREEAALATLEEKGRDELDFSSLELMAQLLYRLERFDECRDIYRKLLKESTDSYDELRGANLQAVEVQLADSDPSVSSSIETRDDSYEQLYNEACRKILNRDYSGAITSLEKAESLCREMLAEDGYAEEEIEEEVAVMKTQGAFCYQMMGDTDSALKEYTNIIKQRPNDAVLLAVASTNTVSLRKGEQSLFDTRKKLKACQGPKLEQKLSPVQKRVAAYNNALLQLHSNQFELCRKALTELKSKYENVDEECVLIEAALLVRQKETGKAVELLKSFKESHKGPVSTQIQFALAQLYLSEGRVSPALTELNEMEDARWTPGVVSLVVSANLGLENQDSALKTLTQAIKHHKQNQTDTTMIGTLMEQCASLYLKFGQQEQASKYLEDLRKLRPDDPKVLAKLIQAYARFNPQKADEVSRNLPQSGNSKTKQGIDSDALEDAGWILLGERYRQKKEAKQTPKPGVDVNLLNKSKKKKRKPKLPKNIDPNVVPDPERWIPKYERSTYRKKKDKRAKDREIGRGTQGAPTTAAATDLDSSTKPAASPITPGSPNAGSAGPTPVGPRQQKPAGGAKQNKTKKKKGGNKW